MPILGGGMIRRRGVSFVGAYDAIPSITAAYGMRRLRTAHTGALLRIVKDATGYPEADIGYTPTGDLDTAAIVAHLGGNAGYITKWYDQSGNGYDAAQATLASMPLYVASGQNSKPVVQFDNVDDALVSSVISSGAKAILVCLKATIVKNYRFQIGLGDWNNFIFHTGSDRKIYAGSTTSGRIEVAGAALSTMAIYNLHYTGGQSVLRRNSSVIGGPKTQAEPEASATFSMLQMGGDVCEVVVYDPAYVVAAEVAANSYWSVY